jgi:predicted transcriptional regulator
MKNRIEEVLVKQGRSKAWLSKVSGIQRPYITKLCSGKIDPRLSTLRLIARALDCKIDDLWPMEED